MYNSFHFKQAAVNSSELCTMLKSFISWSFQGSFASCYYWVSKRCVLPWLPWLQDAIELATSHRKLKKNIYIMGILPLWHSRDQTEHCAPTRKNSKDFLQMNNRPDTSLALWPFSAMELRGRMSYFKQKYLLWAPDPCAQARLLKG